MSLTENIRAGLLDGLTTKEIAENLGANPNTVRGIASRVRKQLEETIEAPQDDDLQARLTRANTQIKSLQKALDKADQDRLSDEEVLAKVFGLKQAFEPQDGFLEDFFRGNSSLTGVPMTNWSDWHIGETVFPEEVNGVNAFNMEIAERRVTKLIQKTIDLSKHHMTRPDYPGMVVCLGGDMVTGEIHDELKDSNDEHLLPVVLKTAGWIAAGLKDLADEFGKLFVPCVAGNHGRNTFKIHNKGFAYKNFDWLIYQIVREYLTRDGYIDSQIVMAIPPANEVLFSVYGHRHLLVHGHDIGARGGDGLIGAIGPIKRGSLKVGAQQAAMGRDFDTIIMGHWHQSIVVDGINVNNCLKGYDEFAGKSLRATPTPPSQNLWFQSPKYGRTAYWPVYVDSPIIKAEGKWIEVFS